METFWQLIKALTRAHSLRFAVAAALGFVVIAVVGMPFARDVYPKYLGEEASLTASAGLTTELAKLSAAAERAALMPDIIAAAETSDSDAAQSALDLAVKQEGIWGMSLTNADGMVLTRTTSPNTVADNAFFVRAHGRALALGAEAPASLEKSSADPSRVVLSAGRMVSHHGVPVGALFATQILDDAYARTFRDKYFSRGTQVAFFSSGEGVTGVSIDDPLIRASLRASLPGNQDIMQSGGTPRLLISRTGIIFTISVYEAPGVDGSAGGVILLIPVPGAVLALIGGFIVVPLAIFVLLAITLHRRARSERKYVHYYSAVAAAGLLLLLVSVILYVQFIREIPRAANRPYPLYNSQLRILPESGVFAVGFDQKIKVLLDTGDEDINAISLSLAYDPALTSIERLETTDSPCDFMLEQSIDAALGSIRVTCSIADLNGASGVHTVAAFYLRPKKAGVGRISFGDDTQVLAKDGLGTDVLRTANGASFVFRDSAAQLEGKKTFTVFSQSHSNAERWYKNRNVKVLWSDIGGPYTVKLETEEGTQIAEVEVAHASTTIELPSDGAFTISVNKAGQRLGDISVRADTTPPAEVSLEASDEHVQIGSLVRFRMSAKDLQSGLQRTSYLRINNGLFFPVGKEMYVPFYSVGKHTVTLRSFDKAGNRKDASLDIYVSGSLIDRLSR